MINIKSTILGIDPGARQLGVSVFRGDELVFYAVKSIKMPKREDSLIKLRKILLELLIQYQVKVVALEEVVFVQQRRTFIKIVYDEIKDFLREPKVTVFEYNPNLMRSVICGLQKPTKHNMALILSQKYTELTRYFNVRRLWQVRYYAQLFDAVAVGFVCATELRETRQLSAQPNEIPDV
jgi:Holliday junction resolvasome RuvABC endonuclease subunit